MLNIKEFDGSLKITWLRRFLNDTPEWEEFANHYKVNRLLLSETNYRNVIKNKISNPFWKDVATAYQNWYVSFKVISPIPIPQIPIWGNPKTPTIRMQFSLKTLARHRQMDKR